MSINDQRASERFALDAPVVIQDRRTGEYYDGSIYNYSRGGMYIELDYPLSPGCWVDIVMDTKTGALPRGETCRARVVWCDEIHGAVVLYNYGIGVQYDLECKKPNSKLQVIKGGAHCSNCV